MKKKQKRKTRTRTQLKSIKTKSQSRLLAAAKQTSIPKFNLINHSQFKMPKKNITQCLVAIHTILQRKRLKNKWQRQDLTVVFLDAERARQVNLQFRNKDYATDILSFAGAEHELGELVLCPQVLKRQAQEHQLSFEQELSYMLIHGVLHLLGYDHELDNAEAKKMYALQNSIFTVLSRSKA